MPDKHYYHVRHLGYVVCASFDFSMRDYSYRVYSGDRATAEGLAAREGGYPAALDAFMAGCDCAAELSCNDA